MTETLKRGRPKKNAAERAVEASVRCRGCGFLSVKHTRLYLHLSTTRSCRRYYHESDYVVLCNGHQAIIETLMPIERSSWWQVGAIDSIGRPVLLLRCRTRQDACRAIYELENNKEPKL